MVLWQLVVDRQSVFGNGVDWHQSLIPFISLPACRYVYVYVYHRNIPSGMKFDPSVLPRAKNYTRVTDAQFFAWRKAHWANWCVRVCE